MPTGIRDRAYRRLGKWGLHTCASPSWCDSYTQVCVRRDELEAACAAYRAALEEEVRILLRWAEESQAGGWSTHQVGSQRERAATLAVLLASPTGAKVQRVVEAAREVAEYMGANANPAQVWKDFVKAVAALEGETSS